MVLQRPRITGVAWACVGVVVLGLVALAALVAVRWATPSDGTVVQLSNMVWRADRLRVDFVVGPVSALKPGDEVIGVDGTSLDALSTASSATSSASAPAGRFHVYTVVRDGQLVQVPVEVGRFPLRTFLVRSWPTLLLLVLLLVVGAYVFLRRPRDASARALLVVAGLMWPGAYGWLLGNQVITLAFRGPPVYMLLSEVPLALVWGVVLQFVVTFPGSPAWARRRTTQAAALTAPALVYAIYLVLVLPTAASGYEVRGRLLQVSYPSSSVLPIASAVLFVIVYLHIADPVSRQGARWIAASLAAAALLWFFVWTLPDQRVRATPDPGYVSLILIPCPIAVGVSVLRYRLFDVDAVRRRSLVRLATTMLVVTLFAAVAWSAVVLGFDRGPFALPVTAAVVAALAPLVSTTTRARLTRRVLGSREEPHEIVASLEDSRLLRPGEEQLARLTATLGVALRLSHVAIDLRGPGTQVLSASYGRDRGAGFRLPLVYGSEDIGELVLDAGPHRDPFGAEDRILLDTLKGHVGSIAYNVLTSGQLQGAREQLVVAREEQRRSLHNRLHDGLGGSLTATMMKAEAAAHLVQSEPDRAAGLLRDIVNDCAGMVGELRTLVLDLRPTVLGQLGLRAAIQERALHLVSSGLAHGQLLQVEVRELGRVEQPPAAVEIAAYWIALEAITNCAKHARAQHCRVVLDWQSWKGTVLDLRITDDGRGCPEDAQAGGGTISMSQRADELGGRLVIGQGENGGTSVRVTLPLHVQHTVSFP